MLIAHLTAAHESLLQALKLPVTDSERNRVTRACKLVYGHLRDILPHHVEKVLPGNVDDIASFTLAHQDFYNVNIECTRDGVFTVRAVLKPAPPPAGFAAAEPPAAAAADAPTLTPPQIPPVPAATQWGHGYTRP